MTKPEVAIERRRAFLKDASLFAVAFPATLLSSRVCRANGDATLPSQAAPSVEKRVGGGCETCEAIYDGQPAKLDWQTSIAPAGEPGEPMEIGGHIFRADGKTAAAGVVLYVYHTDAAGLYSPSPEQTGSARRHGHLRGWMRTNERGEYRFTSIRPAAYPGRRIPQHVHPIVKEPGKSEYWIDEYRFDDDPLLTPEERAHAENRGGSGLVRLEKNGAGVWVGRRDIVLGLNVPDYD
jgi:protocatechuate 3,4-dioxygenase beta subunit